MILVDTGPLVAAAARNDPHHEACALLLRQRSGELAVPGPVVAETCYMLESRGGPDVEEAFLRLLAAGGWCVLIRASRTSRGWLTSSGNTVTCRSAPSTPRDLSCRAVRYREVATLDRRHVTVLRPRHVDSLTLLP